MLAACIAALVFTAALVVPVHSHTRSITGASLRTPSHRSVRPTLESESSSEWLDNIGRGLEESLKSNEGFFGSKHREPLQSSCDDLSKLASFIIDEDAAEVDAAEAARARRKVRLGSGCSWLWEPQGESDPGISWENVGLVKDVKIFPEICTSKQGQDDLDTSSHGHSSHVTRAAGGTGNHKRTKRLTAMIRLK